MNVKISETLVEDLIRAKEDKSWAKLFTSIQGKTGSLINTFTKEGQDYINLKVDGNYWDVPRKYCQIVLGKGLTEVLE